MVYVGHNILCRGLMCTINYSEREVSTNSTWDAHAVHTPGFPSSSPATTKKDTVSSSSSQHSKRSDTMKSQLFALLLAVFLATVSGFGSPTQMALGGVNGGTNFYLIRKTVSI